MLYLAIQFTILGHILNIILTNMWLCMSGPVESLARRLYIPLFVIPVIGKQKVTPLFVHFACSNRVSRPQYCREQKRNYDHVFATALSYIVRVIVFLNYCFKSGLYKGYGMGATITFLTFSVSNHHQNRASDIPIA